MNRMSDIAQPFSVTTLEETEKGSVEVNWVVDGSGDVGGFDHDFSEWRAVWTGESIIEARKL